MTKRIQVKKARQYSRSEAEADGIEAWRAAAAAGTTGVCFQGVKPFWVLRHPVPSVWGRWIVQCSTCTQLFLSSGHNTGGGRCAGCHANTKTEAQERQNAARKERRQAHSDELANRVGTCAVCGSEMRVQRTSRKTCSDRCRKRLARRPS